MKKSDPHRPEKIFRGGKPIGLPLGLPQIRAATGGAPNDWFSGTASTRSGFSADDDNDPIMISLNPDAGINRFNEPIPDTRGCRSRSSIPLV